MGTGQLTIECILLCLQLTPTGHANVAGHVVLQNSLPATHWPSLCP